MNEDDATEYGYQCYLCDTMESWATEKAAWTASLWHLWFHHPKDWAERYGADKRPGPLPEMLGRRLEPWESQL